MSGIYTEIFVKMFPLLFLFKRKIQFEQIVNTPHLRRSIED